jgi:hypothetical protein
MSMPPNARSAGSTQCPSPSRHSRQSRLKACARFRKAPQFLRERSVRRASENISSRELLLKRTIGPRRKFAPKPSGRIACSGNGQFRLCSSARLAWLLRRLPISSMGRELAIPRSRSGRPCRTAGRSPCTAKLGMRNRPISPKLMPKAASTGAAQGAGAGAQTGGARQRPVRLQLRGHGH